MTDTQFVAEEFCRRHHLGPHHEPHYWQWSGRHHYCPGTDPDTPAAPELTVDLLIAKYEGRQEGLRAKLRGTDIWAHHSRAALQAQADEINDFLTDLQRLRATQEG